MMPKVGTSGGGGRIPLSAGKCSGLIGSLVCSVDFCSFLFFCCLFLQPYICDVFACGVFAEKEKGPLALAEKEASLPGCSSHR